MAINTLGENNQHWMQLREDIETRDAVKWLGELVFGLPARSPVAIGDSIGRGFLQVTEALVDAAAIWPWRDRDPDTRERVQLGLIRLAAKLRAGEHAAYNAKPRAGREGVFATLLALYTPLSGQISTRQEGAWLSLRAKMLAEYMSQVDQLLLANRAFDASGDHGAGSMLQVSLSDDPETSTALDTSTGDESSIRPVRCYAEQLGTCAFQITQLRNRWPQIDEQDMHAFERIARGESFGQGGVSADRDWWDAFAAREKAWYDTQRKKAGQAPFINQWGDDVRRVILRRFRPLSMTHRFASQQPDTDSPEGSVGVASPIPSPELSVPTLDGVNAESAAPGSSPLAPAGPALGGSRGVARARRNNQPLVPALPDPAGPRLPTAPDRLVARKVARQRRESLVWLRSNPISLLDSRFGLRALPGSSLPILAAALLGDGIAAPEARTRLTMLTAFLMQASLHLYASRLVRMITLEDGASPDPKCDLQLDLRAGILWCKPEARLLARIAETSHGDQGSETTAPCVPVSPLWPLPLPPAILGLLRLLVARYPETAASGDPRTFWVDTDGGVRPLAVSDLVAALRHWADLLPGRYIPMPDDLVRHGAARAWEDWEGLCPNYLPHLTGSYSAPFAVTIAYEAPTVAERGSFAAELLERILEDLQIGLVARFGPDAGSNTRFAELVALAIEHGEVPALAPEFAAMRTGTPRLLDDRHVVTVLRRAVDAARVPQDAPLDALAARVATETMIFLGLRPSELGDLRRRDVGNPASPELWLRVRGKPGGDTVFRHRHIPIPDELTPPWRAYLRRSGFTGRELLFPPALVAALARELPHGGRHHLGTAALRLHRNLGWTPRQLVEFQFSFGHYYAAHPFGESDDGTHRDLRVAIEALAAKRREELESIPLDRVAVPIPPPRRLPVPRAPRPGPLQPIAVALRASRPPGAHPSSTRSVLVDYLCERLSRMRWTEDDAGWHRRLREWYGALVRLDPHLRADNAKRVLGDLQRVLLDHGLLHARINLPPVVAREFDPTVALVGLDDPLGLGLLRSIVDAIAGLDVTAQLQDGDIDLLVWGALRLECPWTDAAAALAAVRWCDHHVRDRVLLLAPPDDAAPRTPRRPLALGPHAEFALLVLRRWRRLGNENVSIFPEPPSEEAFALLLSHLEQRAGDEVAQHSPRSLLQGPLRHPLTHRAVIMRRWAEDLDGMAVASIVGGAIYRPSLGGDRAPLETYVDACSKGLDPAPVRPDAIERAARIGDRSRPRRHAALTEADKLLDGKGETPVESLCEQLTRLIADGRACRAARGTLPDWMSRHVPVTAEDPALAFLAAWATEVDDGPEARIFSQACLLSFVLYRALRPLADAPGGWLDAPIAARRTPARATLRSYLRAPWSGISGR